MPKAKSAQLVLKVTKETKEYLEKKAEQKDSYISDIVREAIASYRAENGD